MIEDVGFESAVDTYIPIFERRNNIVVRYTKSGRDWNIPPEPSIHLYRVLQEALNNVARHSGAKVADVPSKPTSRPWAAQNSHRLDARPAAM